MIILDNPDMRQYVEQGRLEDLTEEILDFEGLENYYPNVLTSVVYDGPLLWDALLLQQYGVDLQ